MNLKQLKKKVEAEMASEREARAKEQIKVIVRRLDQAKQVAKNVERELADAYADLGQSS